ncbi:hypothetical protein [Neorhizobium sp. NCHU2750]|uniref:hypothetical protein n=1 Tax=Neorhizobium sp. NCHU2750 TaxID=1825976 RepID=UPI000EB64CE0|nr:hypothetical protein NCHU2750_08940 [Neorhizobium sp. NCHU2750]
MPTIARRLTIITLMMVIFAISFAAMAIHPTRRPIGIDISSGSLCIYQSNGDCVASL